MTLLRIAVQRYGNVPLDTFFCRMVACWNPAAVSRRFIKKTPPLHQGTSLEPFDLLLRASLPRFILQNLPTNSDEAKAYFQILKELSFLLLRIKFVYSMKYTIYKFTTLKNTK